MRIPISRTWKWIYLGPRHLLFRWLRIHAPDLRTASQASLGASLSPLAFDEVLVIGWSIPTLPGSWAKFPAAAFLSYVTKPGLVIRSEWWHLMHSVIPAGEVERHTEQTLCTLQGLRQRPCFSFPTYESTQETGPGEDKDSYLCIELRGV